MPTEQEIEDHLQGLNRTEQMATPSSDAARCRSIGITNYRLWFKMRGITISQRREGETWQIVSSPWNLLNDSPISLKKDKPMETRET